MPAYGYLRKSSVRDLATETAIETQEREVKALAARFGDTDIILRSDWDVSGAGKYTKKRTGYLDLKDAIATGRCTAVYSYSLSRLGRSVRELSDLFDLCNERSVPLRLVVDAVDTSTASGRLLANVLASVAQFESEVASERQKARNTTKRLAGESLRTRARYGEREGDDPDLVLKVFREQGSYTRAAKVLNEMGLPARDGKKWWQGSVRLVVKRLDPNIKSPGRGRKAIGNFELAKLLICPYCGRFLTGGNTPTKRYACSASTSGITPHGKTTIASSKVLPWVRERTEGYLLSTSTATNATERQVLDEKKNRILDLYADGLISREEVTVRTQPLLERLRELDLADMASESIDWSSSATTINRQLRSLLRGISLNEDFSPKELLFHSGITTVRWTDEREVVVPEGKVLYSSNTTSSNTK